MVKTKLTVCKRKGTTETEIIVNNKVIEDVKEFI